MRYFYNLKMAEKCPISLHRVLGPSLSKKLFPVGRVGKRTASREVGIFFFPNFNFFFKLECTGGEVKKIYIFLKR